MRTSRRARGARRVAVTMGTDALVVALVAALVVVVVVVVAGSRDTVSGLGRSLLLVTAGVAAGVTVGLPALRRRRRRSTVLPSPDEFGDLMDFLQRLAEASGVAGVGLLVVGEVREQVAADGAVLITGPDLSVVAGRDGDTSALLDRTAIRLVVDAREPRCFHGQVARLFAPVVHRGEVVGVLGASRPAHLPFSQADQDKLVLLGPHLGSSLTRAAEHDSTRALAYVDGLTRLANRRRLDHDLPRALDGWLSAGYPVAFAMVDVDHFKQVNDVHGHPVGDEVLRVVAAVVATEVRAHDVVYRYGGEEFSVLLPGADLEEATMVAERIRTAVATRAVVRTPGGADLRVTVSVGVSGAGSADPTALVAEADRALYEAKHGGRNRTVVRPAPNR